MVRSTQVESTSGLKAEFFSFFLAYPSEPAFCLPKCLMDKVNSGHYGRKSGQGFYIWEGDKAVRVAP